MNDSLRADARRNRQKILAAARELFASHGNDVHMDKIAAHAGVGIGSLYRHFSNKQELLTAIVQERFGGMSELARSAEAIEDPRAAFEAVLVGYLEAADDDAGFQLALLGSGAFEWEGVQAEKTEFARIVTRIIRRAADSGAVRGDLTWDDFPVITCGIMSTMYFQPGGADWRRHLTLVLEGLG